MPESESLSGRSSAAIAFAGDAVLEAGTLAVASLGVSQGSTTEVYCSEAYESRVCGTGQLLGSSIIDAATRVGSPHIQYLRCIFYINPAR